MAEDPADDVPPKPDPAANPKVVVDRCAKPGETLSARIGATMRSEIGATARANGALAKAMAQTLGHYSAQLREAMAPWRNAELLRSQFARAQSLAQFEPVAARELRRVAEQMRQYNTSQIINEALGQTVRLAEAARRFTGSDAFRSHLASVAKVPDAVWAIASTLRDFQSPFEKYAEQIRSLPKRVKENLLALAEAGWYLDAEMPMADLIHFKEELASSDPEEVNAALASYFRDALDRIEATLTKEHSDRIELLRDAFAAHREKKYNLSIPLLFAQADGVCLDLTGYPLFANGGLTKYVRRIDPETLERAYLEPLLSQGPIVESAGRRADRPSRLNRHAVMHGESTAYGTEENGLKAISFLNFVSHVLLLTVEHAKGDKPARRYGARSLECDS